MAKTKAAKELREKLQGATVAMTTPFNNDYSVDYEGLRKLTRLFVDGGISNVIAAGSTGEFYSMDDEERKRVINTVVDEAAGKMTVIGTAAHSGTHLAIDLAQYCKDIGCDGVMVTPPYYSFSGFEGLKKHYEMIGEAVDIGIVLYFSGSVLRFPDVNKMVREDFICPPEFKELLSIPYIGAMKDASGNYGWHRDISRELEGNLGVRVMGSDGMSYHLWGHRWGSRCFLTGLGNIWPEYEVDFWNKMERGDLDGAQKIVSELELPYLQATKATGKYWSAVKFLLNEEGLPGGIMRPPILDLNQAEQQSVRQMAQKTGLLGKVAAV
jgi:4-hydroxy-tetrahydrodipicolinate synthase